jgi:protein-S-isoprenylcysteine O-methyltransferase Ste14
MSVRPPHSAEGSSVFTLYTSALAVAAILSLGRGIGVILAFVRTFLLRKRFVAFRFGWIELLVSLEPLILLGMAYTLLREIESLSSTATGPLIAATFGAALIWAALSWTSLFAGHGVLEGHELTTRGAYAVVRHPVYLGAVLIWLGLALAFLSVLTLAIALAYVIPFYILYLRVEENMMIQSFGDEYREYRKRVPMLLPFLRREGASGLQ